VLLPNQGRPGRTEYLGRSGLMRAPPK
jgi:hypothetical protein